MSDTQLQPAETLQADTCAPRIAHHRAVLSISFALLVAALTVTLVVLAAPAWGGPVPDPQLVAALVTAWVVGPLGSVAGFWLGSSVGGRANRG